MKMFNFFSPPGKLILSTCLLFSGLYVQAQQPNRAAALPDPSQHVDITLNRPNDVKEVPAPIKSPVLYPYYTPDGNLVYVTNLQGLPPSQKPADKHEANTPIATEIYRLTLTRAEFQRLNEEKQKYISEHPEEFEIID